MDILGIGPLELIFIILIAIIIFGPRDLVKAGRMLGKLLRQVIKSPTWKAIQDTSKEIRNIPTKLVREAGLDEDLRDIQTIMPKASDFDPSQSNPTMESSKDPQEPRINNQESEIDEFSAWLTPPPALDSKNKSDKPTRLEQE